MKTKLNNIIENCIKNGSPFNGCEGCKCNEQECLSNLLKEHNNICTRDEIIDYIEQ